MAEFRVRSDHEGVFHVSVPSGDFDVVDGVVDLSYVRDEDRHRVEVELSEIPALEPAESAEVEDRSEDDSVSSESYDSAEEDDF